jgi:ketol-acid reductoisomerase
MASRRAPQILRSSLTQLTRTPLNGARLLPALTARAAAVTQSPTVTLPFQQARGMKTIDFAGTKETVYGACFTTCIYEVLIV